mmetsp:Transcript_50700/g.136116  ORF Transcript_50700/g.136116 Transcript_50700/m.136116 type:complete len:163 (-) Transcript_50700:219-707(-)
MTVTKVISTPHGPSQRPRASACPDPSHDMVVGALVRRLAHVLRHLAVAQGRLVDGLFSLFFVPIGDLAVRCLRSSPDEQECEDEGSSGGNLRSAFDYNSAQKDFGFERMVSSTSSTECPSLVTSGSEEDFPVSVFIHTEGSIGVGSFFGVPRCGKWAPNSGR